MIRKFEGAPLTQDERRMLLRLKSAGVLSDAQVGEALRFQAHSRAPLLNVLLARRMIAPRDYATHLADLSEIGCASDALDREELQSDRSLARKFAPADLMRFLFCPVSVAHDLVTVLAVDPAEPAIRRIVEQVIPGCEVVALSATERNVRWRVDELFKDELLDQAIHGLRRASPHYSASTVFTRQQTIVGAMLGLALIAALVVMPIMTLRIALYLTGAFFVLSSMYKLVIGFASLHGGLHLDDLSAENPASENLPVYSILVPVYKEPEVVPTLLRALANLDYPPEKLDVLILMEEHDADTIAMAKAAGAPSYFRFIYVPKAQPMTKPKACNYGLSFCRGEFVTIYDAEDVPEPQQLKMAVQAFRSAPPNLVCVQAALNYFNPRENYLTRMFTLEYSYWFDYMLPGLDRLGLPIPLGGTSNHFPLARLRELGAWDPFNVTEDADLGIRASTRDYTVGVIRSTTFEEANRAYGNWIRQRSRWIKGYMQTWLVHNRRPLSLLRRIGLKRWLSYQFFIGGTCFTFLLNPLLYLASVSMWLMPSHLSAAVFDPRLTRITVVSLITGNLIAVVQCMIAVVRRRLYYLLPFAITNPLYWSLHSYAAYVALWQLFTKPFYWEKTTHGLTTVSVDTLLNSAKPSVAS